MSSEPYETFFSRWKASLEAREHQEEHDDAEQELGAAAPTPPPAHPVVAAVRRVPLAVWTFIGLLAGFVLGYYVPQDILLFGLRIPGLASLGLGVKASLAYISVAAPVIIFFTITPALISMYKTSSAGRFALYVMVGFTLTTVLGGLFALLVSLLFFPDVTVGLGTRGLGAVLGDILGETGGLLFTSGPFKAIWGAIIASVLLYFGGNLAGPAPANPARRMCRTIADIYEIIGVHGVAALGKVLKVIMPFALFAIGVFIVATVPDLIRAGVEEGSSGIEDAPYSPVGAYFVSVGVLILITMLWLLIVSLALTQYTKFPLKRLLRDYLFVVYPFAWATSSSSVSLPLNMEAARKGLGVRPQVRSFILPLGATVNLDGTMMAAVVATIVAGQMVGYTPSVIDLLIALLPLLLITVGTPGIPGGLAFVSAPVMAQLLPLPPGTELLFTGIYVALLIGLNDQFRTAVNTLDNGFLALLMDKWWPERFDRFAEPNPFMEPSEHHLETEGTAGSPIGADDAAPRGRTAPPADG